MSEALTLARIESLFEGYGSAYYGGEAITQTEHALQCAALAEQAGESAAMIAASLLHDVGHLVMAESALEDRRHQEVGARLLDELLGENVVAPVRLHVPANAICARSMRPTGRRSRRRPGTRWRCRAGPLRRAKWRPSNAFRSSPRRCGCASTTTWPRCKGR
jgi:hypothetical protein